MNAHDGYSVRTSDIGGLSLHMDYTEEGYTLATCRIAVFEDTPAGRASRSRVEAVLCGLASFYSCQGSFEELADALAEAVRFCQDNPLPVERQFISVTYCPQETRMFKDERGYVVVEPEQSCRRLSGEEFVELADYYPEYEAMEQP